MASRQYAYQLRHKAKGLCIICTNPNVDGTRCQIHLEINRKYQRIYLQKLRGHNPWKPGGPGRPPIK